jgi:OOP family OmpA-OmpF porin
MRLSAYLPVTLAILIGGAACYGVAVASVSAIESQSEQAVRNAIVEDGQDWAEVEVDGLQVILTGAAPDEAARFAAVSAAGRMIDASRVIDRMEVAATDTAAGPPFTVDILRNDDGVSLIGLVPAGEHRADIVARIGRMDGATVTDLLEDADYPVPATWPDALAFGLHALERLPRSKITIEARRVTVTAISDSAAEKRATEEALRASVPEGVELVLALSAPRPVLTPFTLRFVIDDRGPRFDACSADTPAARATIVAAARDAGLAGETSCLVGLGQPSARWAEAAVAGIGAVAALGGGSVTFSDADVTLQAPPGTRQADFDRIAGRLESGLPEVFSLTALMPPPAPDAEEPEDDGDVPLEFVATRDAEGGAALRGRLPDDLSREAVLSLARARFGSGKDVAAIRIVEDTPSDWPVRVMAGIEALSMLNSGTLTVRPDRIRLAGETGDPEARDSIARLLTARLGDEVSLSLDVAYVEALDPIAALPTPEECLAGINAALAEKKITFAPGSTDIDGDALVTIDRLSETLRDCQTVRMEIGGHTDSQGSEGMNERLSQERADAVLNAIMARRVLTSNLTAKGYGEAQPIADNGTEEGREANRRIEFRLLPTEDSGEEAAADEDGEAGATPGDAETPARDEAEAGEAE